MIRHPFWSAVLAIAVLLGGAGSASADPFAMHVVMRNFCCTDWTDRTASPPANNPGGGAFGFLGGQATQKPNVSLTVDQNLAAAPFAVSFPQSAIGVHFLVASFMHPNNLLDTLTLGVDIDNPSAVMSAQNGPGSFEFCPDAVGPAPNACAAPVFATGGTMSRAFHGRIAVEAGPNQFGGAMGWLGPGLVGVIQQHNAAYTQFTQNNFNVPFSVVGGGTTSMGLLARAVSSTLVDTIWPSSAMAVTPTFNTQQIGATGHPWTTGMVTASITQLGVPPFQQVAVTGGDTRNTTGPDIGSGNLTLVTASLYQDFVTGRGTPRATTMSIEMPEPAMVFSVAAGALALALVGASRRRR